MKRTLKTIAAGACAASMAFSMAGCVSPAPQSSSSSVASSASVSAEVSSSAGELSSSGASASSSASSSESSFSPSENEIEEVYGPPIVYEPDEEPVETIYGPPWMLDGESVPPEESSGADKGSIEDAEDISDSFDVEINMNPLIYGPPQAFGFDSANPAASETSPEA